MFDTPKDMVAKEAAMLPTYPRRFVAHPRSSEDGAPGPSSGVPVLQRVRWNPPTRSHKLRQAATPNSR